MPPKVLPLTVIATDSNVIVKLEAIITIGFCLFDVVFSYVIILIVTVVSS